MLKAQAFFDKLKQLQNSFTLSRLKGPQSKVATPPFPLHHLSPPSQLLFQDHLLLHPRSSAETGHPEPGLELGSCFLLTTVATKTCHVQKKKTKKTITWTQSAKRALNWNEVIGFKILPEVMEWEGCFRRRCLSEGTYPLHGNQLIQQLDGLLKLNTQKVKKNNNNAK